MLYICSTTDNLYICSNNIISNSYYFDIAEFYRKETNFTPLFRKIEKKSFNVQ